jgi:hypothetical protein
MKPRRFYFSCLLSLLLAATLLTAAGGALAQPSPAPAIGLRTQDAQPAPPPEEIGDKGAASSADMTDCHNNRPEACQQAAYAGNAEAMRRIALAYYHGSWGYPRDNAQFMAWLEKAARARFLPAQTMLATSYTGDLQGGGIKDPLLAYVWYSVAAARAKDEKRKHVLTQGSRIFQREIPSADLPRAETLRKEYIELYGK